MSQSPSRMDRDRTSLSDSCRTDPFHADDQRPRKKRKARPQLSCTGKGRSFQCISGPGNQTSSSSIAFLQDRLALLENIILQSNRQSSAGNSVEPPAAEREKTSSAGEGERDMSPIGDDHSDFPSSPGAPDGEHSRKRSKSRSSRSPEVRRVFRSIESHVEPVQQAATTIQRGQKVPYNSAGGSSNTFNDSPSSSLLASAEPPAPPTFDGFLQDDAILPSSATLDGHGPRLGALSSPNSLPAPVQDTLPVFDLSLPARRNVKFGDSYSTEGVDEHEQSHGTLVITRSGRSKYLGRTAPSEWLKNQEAMEQAESPPPVSRFPSPNPEDIQLSYETRSGLGLHTSRVYPPTRAAFPFNAASRAISTGTIVAQLPNKSDGRVLIEAYFRHFSWHFNVVSRKRIEEVFEKAYSLRPPPNQTSVSGQQIAAQDLALLFIIFAMGAYYNLELPPDDSLVDDYLLVAQNCLSKGDFLSNNTLAGVQTLHIMAHLLLSMDSGKNGDSAWPLWGLTARLTQAMGLHRDGARWNLPESSIEERRRVFWECHATELLSANCFSRPSALNSAYVDTAYPRVVERIDLFQQVKFQMSRIFGQVLDHSSRVQQPPYSDCVALHQQIYEFERNVPFELKCRPVLCALPSAYPTQEAAFAASLPIDKKDLQRTFQQFTLAMNLSELIVFLERPYFAQALHASPSDPTRSQYGQSYLTVVERCNAIVVIASNLYSLYPQAAARHWWIWYHAFSSAICMGTLILKNPQNTLVGFALALIDTTHRIYESVVKNRNSPRMVRNLHWLGQLRQKVNARLAQSPGVQLQPTQQLPHEPPTDVPTDTGAGTEVNDQDDVDLVGWRTKLVDRAGQGLVTSMPKMGGPILRAASEAASTVSPVNFDAGSAFVSGLAMGNVLPMESQMAGSSNAAASWEAELNQFWDSVITHDVQPGSDQGSFNWWGLDPVFGISDSTQLDEL
ncbi:hypothetical protein I316_06265 [Kwoniella heveanensis BCC8398]|uniref:Xylanolytic transcriptional activator regulatory domain-containing protein n=1 Tax=Kwoniella heveanensis BCC8398 TaxID=1296120 RepID=A0A1B9GLY9_9TREE|nr:hypothetical protein I316_06265 [Kwoniella heveanensis BCC8398]